MNMSEKGITLDCKIMCNNWKADAEAGRLHWKADTECVKLLITGKSNWWVEKVVITEKHAQIGKVDVTRKKTGTFEIKPTKQNS